MQTAALYPALQLQVSVLCPRSDTHAMPQGYPISGSKKGLWSFAATDAP